MDGDFAVSRPLVRPGLPRIRFLFVGSRLRSTLPSDPASRRRPCASLALHLHQVVQGTCTPRLSNMLGTRLYGHASMRALPEDRASHRVHKESKGSRPRGVGSLTPLGTLWARPFPRRIDSCPFRRPSLP